MHQANRLLFSRAANEFARWRAVEKAERSPGAAWWWGPAIAVAADDTAMPLETCTQLDVPPGATYATGAAVLIGAIADQTALPWPDDFPRKIPSHAEHPQQTLAET